MPNKLANLKMSNGVEFPIFGLGTWQAYDSAQLTQALDVALESGYRHIDTAEMYLNENIIGDFLESKFKSGKFKRSDIFITSKLAPFWHQPDYAEWAIDESLKNLKTDYIDLFLIHNPCPYKPIKGLDTGKNREKWLHNELEIDLTPHIETWKVLEKYYKEGKLKSIGISNFSPKQIQELYDQAEIKPMNLQVECHIYFPQHELHDLCKKLNITMTSYATMGSPGRMSKLDTDPEPLEDPVIQKLAQKYHKTPAQFLLRQMMQRKIAVIPKSVTPERIRSNYQVFDFNISEEDMKQVHEIEGNTRLFQSHFVSQHPWYPLRN